VCPVGSKFQTFRCGRCEYDLHGLPLISRKCPKCGWPIGVEFPRRWPRWRGWHAIVAFFIFLYFPLLGRSDFDEFGLPKSFSLMILVIGCSTAIVISRYFFLINDTKHAEKVCVFELGIKLIARICSVVAIGLLLRPLLTVLFNFEFE